MNTNALKKFAQEARSKLISQVGAKLEYVLTSDSAELREKVKQVKQLQELINSTSREQLIDKVAYTWFNRLMALRFMDANDYQPLGMRIVTPKDGYTLPELLDEAKQGNISEELHVKHQHVYDVLDGKIVSSNPQNEAYKELLIGACNHLNKVFPFLFEKIDDYAELLLPDDLTSEFSIVEDMRNGMTKDNCKEVEVIGWLYQFYISELNDELISSKLKYKKEDLAPATQLFTPKWIVQYMVDNTLGQVWSELNPSTKIIDDLEYYIKPKEVEKLAKREYKKIEDIKFFEPCVGSGHILSYAFDVFFKMYEEEGYDSLEIPELIISKNLYGIDIDQRAAQLASFVLLIKGREKNKRFFRAVEKRNIQPNIFFYEDFEFDSKFNNATSFGSLIKIDKSEVVDVVVDESSLFSERQKKVLKLYELLSKGYDVVVTNPPYVSSNRMMPDLKTFIETSYPHCKHDLYSAFVFRCLDLCNENGMTAFMTPFVWMFIPSFEKFRTTLIDNHSINNLIQLEYSGFDGATVPICTFTLRKKNQANSIGSYIKLSDFKGSKLQAPKSLEAIANKECSWFYTFNQDDFRKIPGDRIGFWLSLKILDSFTHQLIQDKFSAKAGIVTGNDLQFIRAWQEVSRDIICLHEKEYEYSSEKKWVPVNKGGDYRKYYGNCDYIINIYDLWTEGKTSKSVRRGDVSYYYKPAITWSSVTSGKSSFRFSNNKLFNTVSPAIFSDDNSALVVVLCFLNSKISEHILPALNPTLHMLTSDVQSLPYLQDKIDQDNIERIGKSQIEIEKMDWNSRETSSEFKINELIKHKGHDIEESYDLYKSFWLKKFTYLVENEEKINESFIKAFGLENEINSKVELTDITILKEETKISKEGLKFDERGVFFQFISYAVGCMFGRYSLDKEGLILANQGETLENYLKKVEKSVDEVTFLPDSDNIIPVLDDEWFEDDIVGRFYEFLKVVFGLANFDKNLAFVEECIGKDIRKYFIKDFYNDHVLKKRYNKRPIYWMFSSPKGSFNVLVYMHRYTQDTLNQILNDYLKEYREKLNTKLEHLDHLIESGSSSEQTKAAKEKDKLKVVLLELQEYEREVLYPLATERISINLDDGVLVNYNKFGKAIKEVKGLNDKKTKEKVRKFDWIDSEEII